MFNCNGGGRSVQRLAARRRGRNISAIEQIAQAAFEPIEFPDDERVAGGQIGDSAFGPGRDRDAPDAASS